MVNTTTTTTATTLNSDKPSIVITVNTFIAVSAQLDYNETFKLCKFSLSIKNVKVALAFNTFQRVFNYTQHLANNDINPLTAIQPQVSNFMAPTEAQTPFGGVSMNIDYSQIPAVVNLDVTSNNLRLDYMDEFFTSTLEYLNLSLTNDLNPV
ncbi:MAG: hypothetical protein KA716_25945 [Gloeotrichia echinulata DEX184]|nr:hypothetical protein [Gloeotrichia echinulata DEX184]